VESVQVFDELTEQARYAGIEDGETQKASNIITNSKTRRSDFLRAEASAGHDISRLDDFRYLVGGSYIHTEDNSRLTVTGSSNNASKSGFGQDDLNSAGEVDSNGNPKNQRQGIQTVHGIGINYSVDKKAIKFTGSYFFNYSDVDRQSKTIKNLYPTTNSKGEEVRQVNRTTDIQHYTRNYQNLDMRFEWQPSEKDVIVISPTATYNDTRYDLSARDYNMVRTGGDSTRTRKFTNSPQASTYASLYGSAMYTRRFEKRGRTLSGSIYYSVNATDPNDRYEIDTSNYNYKSMNINKQPVWDWYPGALQNFYQQRDNYSNVMRLRVSYAEPIGKYHRLIVNAIGMNEWGNDDTRYFLYNPATDLYDSVAVNNKKYLPNSLSTVNYGVGGGIGYSYIQSKLTVYTDLNYQRIFRTLDFTEPYQKRTNVELNDFQPTVSLRYTLYKRRYLRFSYEGRTLLPDIRRMQDYVDRTGTIWNEGNPNLQAGYRHSFKLFYNASDSKRGTNLTVTLRGEARSNLITSATFFPDEGYIFSDGEVADSTVNGITLVKWVNLDGYYMAGTGVTYSMPLKKIKSNLNLSLDYSYTRTPSMYKVLNYANRHSINARVGLTSNISEKVDFNFYSSTYADFTANSALDDRYFLNQNLSYSLNWIFWKGLVFNTLITWKYYDTSIAGTPPNHQFIINAGIGKKFLKRQNGELRFTLYDCLNQSLDLRRYANNSSIDDVDINVMGRYAMLRFSYRFNSLWNPKPAKSKMPKSAVTPQTTGSGIKRIGPGLIKPW